VSTCYECGNLGSACAWNGSSCGPGDYQEKRWFENYGLCTDTKNICFSEDQGDNESISLYMKPSPMAGNIIPKNYYCHYSHHITQQEYYTMDIFRYDQRGRYSANSEIDFKLTVLSDTIGNTLNDYTNEGNTIKTDYISDSKLLSMSNYNRRFGTS
jgi:hypothetical protein